MPQQEHGWVEALPPSLPPLARETLDLVTYRNRPISVLPIAVPAAPLRDFREF